MSPIEPTSRCHTLPIAPPQPSIHFLLPQIAWSLNRSLFPIIGSLETFNRTWKQIREGAIATNDKLHLSQEGRQ
jgi:hypothetical protein